MSKASQALKALKEKYESGQIDKQEYDRQRVLIINRMTDTQVDNPPPQPASSAPQQLNLSPAEELKIWQERFNKGEISKQEYDQNRVRLINKLTETDISSPAPQNQQNQPIKATSASKNPSRKVPVQNRGTDNVMGNNSNGANFQSPTPQEMSQEDAMLQEMQEDDNNNNNNPSQPNDDKPKAKLYAAAAQRVSQGFLNSGNFGLKPQVRDKSEIERTSHHPIYQFGGSMTGVADVDELLEFLERLDAALENVESAKERHGRIQSELPAGVFVSKAPTTLKNEDHVVDKVKAWMILKFAAENKVKDIEEYINLGVSVDYQDEDSANTPLIAAAVAGQQEAIYYLVEKGANVNAQNRYGNTALHELVKNKRENLAIWLIKHGADIYLENKRTYSAFDLALPWFQKDMKKVASGVDITAAYTVNENFQAHYTLSGQKEESAPKNISETSKSVKIYFKNGSYKSVFVTSNITVLQLLETVAKKMNLSEKDAENLQLIESQKGKERKLLGGEKVLEAKRAWPIISDTTSKIDPCHFRVEVRSGNVSQHVVDAYNKFIST